MPVLLHHTLSTPTSSSNPSADPGFTTLTQALTHLSRTHKDTLRDCIVALVTDLLSSANRPELHKILFLLRVASECPPVLEIAAAQCLEKCMCASKALQPVVCSAQGNFLSTILILMEGTCMIQFNVTKLAFHGFSYRSYMERSTTLTRKSCVFQN